MEITATIKLIIAGVLSAIVLGVVGVIWYQHHEVATLTTTNAQDKGTIAAQATSVSEAHATVKSQQESSAITVNTVVQAGTDTAKTNQTVATIQTNTVSKEQQIRDAYNNLPKGTTTTAVKTGTTTTNMTQADALSNVRVRSMWQVYCQLNTNANQAACLVNQ